MEETLALLAASELRLHCSILCSCVPFVRSAEAIVASPLPALVAALCARQVRTTGLALRSLWRCEGVMHQRTDVAPQSWHSSVQVRYRCSLIRAMSE